MQRLREIRKNKKITMKDLAVFLGISESAVSLYETGKSQPDHETLKKIADYFDVSIDYLLGRTDCKKTFTEEEYYNIIRIADKLGITYEELINGGESVITPKSIDTYEKMVEKRADALGVSLPDNIDDKTVDAILLSLSNILKKKNVPHK